VAGEEDPRTRLERIGAAHSRVPNKFGTNSASGAASAPARIFTGITTGICDYNAPVKSAPLAPRSANPVLGHPVARLEDSPLLIGRGAFVGDIGFPHQLHMRVVRSPYANAVLRSVNLAPALAAPGTVAVWTAADIADLPPIDFRDPAAEALRPYRQPLLARERLRYVGEPVAVVFATDPYLAEDAADMVAVTADELRPILDASAAPGSFAPGQSSEALVLRAGYGDVETAFATAHAVVALDLTIGRHSGVPLETRGALARFDAARDVLELYGATKVPHATAMRWRACSAAARRR
jgi:aerobic carbon-monoxide dehydrogenase large subunit